METTGIQSQINKLELVSKINDLESDMAKCELEYNKCKRLVIQARVGVFLGSLPGFIGVIVFLSIDQAFYFGSFLGVVGILLTYIAYTKEKRIQKKMEESEDRLIDIRTKISQLRTQLAIL